MIDGDWRVVPLKPGQKRPEGKDWQNRIFCADDFGEQNGIGILTGHGVIALDIDVYDPQVAQAIADKAKLRFGETLERIGQAPKLALFYAAPDAIKKSKAALRPTGHAPQGKAEAVEVLARGQQCVAYGIHPDTGQPYTWTGGTPWQTPVDDLPLVTAQEVDDFLAWVTDTYGEQPKLSERASAAITPQARTAAGGDASTFWRAVNDAAMAAQDQWATTLFPMAKKHATGAHRVTSHDLCRDLEEDISIHPDGIWDFGTEESKTPIDLVKEHRGVDAKNAAFWLCEQLCIDPATLGWNGRTADRPHQNSQVPDISLFLKSLGRRTNDQDVEHGPAPEIAPQQVGLPLRSSGAFCAARQPADYLVDGSLRCGWLYTLTAPTGHGKSAVTLALAYAVAKLGWMGSNECKTGSVLFLAGENHDDIRERWIALCEHNGVDPQDLPVTFMEGVHDLKGSLPILREYFRENPLTLVCVDTLAAYFDGDNENDNAQQQAFATDVLRPLTELQGRPTVVVPSHPTKGAGKDALTPKGGSSLLNAVDGNLSAWKSDDVVKIHWQGKFRGAQWKPWHVQLSEYRSDTLLDSKGRQMPTVIARAMLDSEIGKATEAAKKVENQVLKLILDGMTTREMAEEVFADGQRGVPKTRVDRVIKTLKDNKWIHKVGRKLAVTTEGLEVLKQAGKDCHE